MTLAIGATMYRPNYNMNLRNNSTMASRQVGFKGSEWGSDTAPPEVRTVLHKIKEEALKSIKGSSVDSRGLPSTDESVSSKAYTDLDIAISKVKKRRNSDEEARMQKAIWGTGKDLEAPLREKMGIPSGEPELLSKFWPFMILRVASMNNDLMIEKFIK